MCGHCSGLTGTGGGSAFFFSSMAEAKAAGGNRTPRTTAPPKTGDDSAPGFALVRRGDAQVSNPTWCAQRYACISYFNECARSEEALDGLLQRVHDAKGLAELRAVSWQLARVLVGARALALPAQQRLQESRRSGCQLCAWEKCAGPLCQELLQADGSCACGFSLRKEHQA